MKYLKKNLYYQGEYDKIRANGGGSLQIENLSAAQARAYGSVLSALPEGELHVLHRSVSSGTAAEEFCSEETVILDYVSGMSLLVVYEERTRSLYYLDRIFALRPGVRFSVAALDDFCRFDCYTRRADALQVLAERPAMQLRDIANDLRLERLYTFFYQECARDFYFRGEQHEALELVYVDHGELHNLVGGTDILLRQQQLLLIDRNIWHMQYADFPVSFLTVSFRVESSSPCSRLAGRCLELSARQTALMRQMLLEDAAAEYAYDSTESLLRLLLIDLLRHETACPKKPARPLPATNHAEQRLVDQLIQTISANAGRKLSLQQLASSVHISTTYLHRIFRTQLNMTPGSYLAKIRIEESKLLLRDGSLSMGEAAKQLGFSSQQQFSRQFRSVTGMTPSEYVKTLR